MSTSTSSLQPAKLIFAPGETSTSTPNPSQAGQASQAAQFQKSTLHRHHLNPDPIIQFHTWFNDPLLHPAPTSPSHPTQSTAETCTLSTAHLPSGRVSSRTVYLKELDPRGFVIYSNWGSSRKADDFSSNRHVALCFWWKATERQVRVEGVGERLSAEESTVYFRTRGRGSRVGAWASRQTEVLRPRREGDRKEGGVGGDDDDDDDDDGRAQLEEQVSEVEKRFEGEEDIPVPEFWGGLRVIPDMIEFWQGRESRLHDRFRYQRMPAGQGDAGGEWKIERLNP